MARLTLQSNADPANPSEFTAEVSGARAMERMAISRRKFTCSAPLTCTPATRAPGPGLSSTCQEGISSKYGYTWTQPNIVSGDTGRRIYGSDYYQNLMLWIVPAAMDGHDLQKTTAGGQLINKVLDAGKPV